MKKLIIWDFDGVIADTEKLWVKVWQKNINENFGLNWDFKTAYHYFAGMSIKTKTQNLAKLGINVSDELIEKMTAEEIEVMNVEMKITKGISEIFENKSIKQCIATGGIKSKTAKKLKVIDIEKYFPKNHVFTADMVEHGKPEPDLFLFAAKQMGVAPKDCIIVEDSIAGLTAAKRAGIDVIAFAEHQEIGREDFIKKVKELGVEKIVFNIEELKKILF